MLKEADRLGVPPDGRAGGINLDEMSIQPDLQFAKCGENFKLVGFINMGEEADLLRNLRLGKKEKTLASHVLQIQFLGFTGFRFPIAHFPSHGATAMEIHLIFWQTVDMLYSYGFVPLYTSMDGAITNRQFMKINFPNGSPSQSRYITQNSVFPDVFMVMIMDYSHCIKKIRNSIYSSGLHGTRSLESADGVSILWKFWSEAFEFDRTNPLQCHRKLSHEHIVLDNAAKMRNHLAEQVLDEDMLQLMLQFKISLGAEGPKLNGCIELLKQTSVLIKIFRDNRPVTCTSDERLDCLSNILQWFRSWENEIHKFYQTPKERSKHLLTEEAREDLESCIVGVQQLVVLHQAKFPGASINLSRINSDVIENHFCQQRGKHY
jgi:hypothetical protein